MFDTNKYLSIPFLEFGRDFYGCDCYGLVRLIYKNEFEIDIPEFCGIGHKEYLKISDKIDQCKCTSDWKSVNSPRLGDVVLLKNKGVATHVGLLVSADKFIHMSENIGCSIDGIAGSRWNSRIEGFYRNVRLEDKTTES